MTRCARSCSFFLLGNELGLLSCPPPLFPGVARVQPRRVAEVAVVAVVAVVVAAAVVVVVAGHPRVRWTTFHRERATF